MSEKYRHEWKHVLNLSDMFVLRQRLRAVMEHDPHAVDGKYHIRSLYFDNLDDKALREKVDGVNMREKFRIRLYNFNTAVINLEKKEQAKRSRNQVFGALNGGGSTENRRRRYRLDARRGSPLGAGTLLQDALPGHAAKDHRRLHQRAVHLPRGKCTRYSGL